MKTTEFEAIYNCFYSKVTDDMYMELDEEQTHALLEELLLNAIPNFEFPRVNLNNYDLYEKCFNLVLSDEEINILATYMITGWFEQQLASVELTRMKYSGSDFKFTSQANHMQKLLVLKKDYERVGFHLQRLYKRRQTDKNGVQRSTLSAIMGTSVREGNVGERPVLYGSQDFNRSPQDDEWEEMVPLANDVNFTDDSNISTESSWRGMKQIRRNGNCGSGWDNM